MIVDIAVPVIEGDDCHRLIKRFATVKPSPQFIQRKKAAVSSKQIQVLFQRPAAYQHRRHIAFHAGRVILHHSVVADDQRDVPRAPQDTDELVGSGPMQCAGNACFSESPQHIVRFRMEHCSLAQSCQIQPSAAHVGPFSSLPGSI